MTHPRAVFLVTSDHCGWSDLRRQLRTHDAVSIVGDERLDQTTTEAVAAARRVFGGVLTQTMLETLLAASIAIPVAAIAVQVFARDLVLEELPLPASTSIPVSSAVRGLMAALAVGLVAGLLPAMRAARSSVVQALRD